MGNAYFINRDNCPACNSATLRTIYQKPFNEPPIWDYLCSGYLIQDSIDFKYFKDATYLLVECQVCGLIFQKEILNDILMEKLYEHWIDSEKVFDSHQNESLSYYSYHAQEIMQIISWLNKAPSELSLLDFGMGLGRWALMAKAFGCKSYGSELSQICLDFAESNGVNIVAWDEIPQYKFDFINTEQVFEHISNPLQTLCHLKKGLRTTGLLKISVPTANDMHRRLKIMDWKSPKGAKNSLNPVAPLEHINFFIRKSLIMMASIAGLKEVFLPLKNQYRYTTDWGEIKRIGKNLLLPVYRNILKRRNYLFFQKP